MHKPEPKTENPTGKWPLLLIVDDDSVIRIAFRQYFERLGYRTLEAENGEQGVALFRERNPDMVLLDAEMPVLDGFQACAAMKKSPQGTRTPIIMVTAHHDEQSVDKAFACGASDYITKPVNWAVFRHRTQTLLRTRHIEQALVIEKDLLQSALENTSEAVIRADARGAIQMVNPAAEKLLRSQRRQIIDMPLLDVLRITYHDREINHLTDLTNSEDPHWFAQRAQADEGAPRYQATVIVMRGQHGTPTNFLLMLRDQSAEKRLTNKLAHHVAHDALTGLLKRREFVRAMDSFRSEIPDQLTRFALIYIDLDRLKSLNDCYGHAAGDEALRHVAGLLEVKTGADSSLGRIGGDEFGVFLPNCTGTEAHVIAQQLCESITEQDFVVNNTPFPLVAHAGVIEGTNANHAHYWLQQGSKACGLAKQIGNRVYWMRNLHETDYHEGGVRDRVVAALAADRLELYIQQLMPLKSGQHNRLCEVFVRLLGEDGAPVLPKQFFPAAERFSVARNIDRWVVRHVLRHLSREDAPSQEPIMCINLTNDSLLDERFSAFLKDEITYWQAPPHRLCFEIAECTVLNEPRHALRTLRSLKELGCHTAIDDFGGGGMAALNTLRGFNIDFIKIDGSWVRNITNDAMGHTMVRSLNDIGHALGSRTIAEFVENDEILHHVRELGVDYAQGFGIDRPTPLRNR
jgi:diguanylate cyclase (GGDEF)-like protein/PAS domain S-box-containing protein